jgi:hypothetical protein
MLMCIYDRGLEIFASFEFWVFFGLDSVVLSSNNLSESELRENLAFNFGFSF